MLLATKQLHILIFFKYLAELKRKCKSPDSIKETP